jgi:hypothetical protein
MGKKRVDPRRNNKTGNEKKTRKPSAAQAAASRETTIPLPAEKIKELQRISATAKRERLSVGACWFRVAGERDQCFSLTKDDCDKLGGEWLGGACVE